MAGEHRAAVAGTSPPQANLIIAEDLEITTGFEDAATERRYWEIAGFSRVPCGGTHVRRTGEIGGVRLKRNNIGKGKERIEISRELPFPLAGEGTKA